MRNSKKYSIVLLLALMISMTLIFSSGCSIMNASIDSVEGYAKEYLKKVLTVDLKKVDVNSFTKENMERDTKAMNKYLENRFKKYFTEDGYASFLENSIYSKRAAYLKAFDIKDILNIIIYLEPVTATNEADGKMIYDYSIEYYIVNTSEKSEKVVDQGQLEILKQKNGRYRINNDDIEYSDVFS